MGFGSWVGVFVRGHENAMTVKLTPKMKAVVFDRLAAENKLSANEFRIAHCFLFIWMNGSGRLWPSYETIAKVANCGKKTVGTVINKLVRIGFITRTRRYLKKWCKNRQSNMYVLGDKFFAIALAVKIAHKPIRDFKKDTPEVTHSLQAQSKGAAAAPMTVFEAKLAATMESFSAAFAERAARMAVAVPS